MKNIIYTPEKCIGCGICYSEVPTIFSVDSFTGKALLCDSTEKSGVFIRVLWPDEHRLMATVIKMCSIKAIKLG